MMVIYIQMMSVHKIKLEVGDIFCSIIIILATLGLVLCRPKFSGFVVFHRAVKPHRGKSRQTGNACCKESKVFYLMYLHWVTKILQTLSRH